MFEQDLAQLIRNLLASPRQPGPLYIHHVRELQGENGMADRSIEAVLLPAVEPVPGGDAVVSRKLTVTTEGESDQVFDLTPTDTEAVTSIGYPQDVDVTFTLVDKDDDGKESPPRVRTVKFTDESVPNQPGELNFRHDGEIQG